MEAARIMREALGKSEPLYAYAIQAGPDGPVKIGVAKRPADRLKTLQTANPAELLPLAAWRILPFEERHIHQEYVHLHIRGEWFHPDPDLISFVEAAGGDFDDWIGA